MACPVKARIVGILRHSDVFAKNTEPEEDSLGELIPEPVPSNIRHRFFGVFLTCRRVLNKSLASQFLGLAGRLEIWTKFGVKDASHFQPLSPASDFWKVLVRIFPRPNLSQLLFFPGNQPLKARAAVALVRPQCKIETRIQSAIL